MIFFLISSEFGWPFANLLRNLDQVIAKNNLFLVFLKCTVFLKITLWNMFVNLLSIWALYISIDQPVKQIYKLPDG